MYLTYNRPRFDELRKRLRLFSDDLVMKFVIEKNKNKKCINLIIESSCKMIDAYLRNEILDIERVKDNDKEIKEESDKHDNSPMDKGQDTKLVETNKS